MREVHGLSAVFFREGVVGTEYLLPTGEHERIAPTAFARTLAAGHDITANVGHVERFTLARTSDGSLQLTLKQASPKA